MIQSAYRVVVKAVAGQAVVWDSGKVKSNESVAVEYAGPPLNAATPYSWSVTTWTKSGESDESQSDPSAPAVFVTSLSGNWSSAAHFISTPNSSATFGYFRKEIDLPWTPLFAVAFVAAEVDTVLLGGYKLFIDGALIDVGPGRGEAPVLGGDGLYRSLPYATLDVTRFLAAGKHALALQAMHKPPSVMLQLVLRFAGGQVMTVATDATWRAFNGDVHRQPGPPRHAHSAGTGFLEYIDARGEPVGWQLPGFVEGGGADSGWQAASATTPSASQCQNLHAKMEPPLAVRHIAPKSVVPAPPPPPPATHPVTCGIVPEHETLPLGCPAGAGLPPLIAAVRFASFGTPSGSCATELIRDPTCDAPASAAVLASACVNMTGCAVKAERALFGDDPCYGKVKALAVQIECPPGPPAPPPPAPSTTSFVADFGREFQGGLWLRVGDGTAGQAVHIACGETLKGWRVGTTWGWEFDWTLRKGEQLLEQHKYMECRFVSLIFSGAAPVNFSLGAWKVHYPWYPEEAHFSSSNATLDAVWELACYTVEAASLSTYSDSNTRERRPYEADGIIAASARLLVQRDYLWARHSHAWVLQFPTWPVEWKQLSPFLGWQDYLATGRADLALAFLPVMHERTMIGHLDATGLLDTSQMGRHIVDWMPDGREADETVQRGEFTASAHMSVSNAFAAHGLDLLARMAEAGGRHDNATAFAAEAAALKAAMMAQMWNGSAFCDGVCSEVGGASLVMSNMFTLCFGLVPAASVPSVWRTVTAWGLEQMGDYGAFWV